MGGVDGVSKVGGECVGSGSSACLGCLPGHGEEGGGENEGERWVEEGRWRGIEVALLADAKAFYEAQAPRSVFNIYSGRSEIVRYHISRKRWATTGNCT